MYHIKMVQGTCTSRQYRTVEKRKVPVCQGQQEIWFAESVARLSQASPAAKHLWTHDGHSEPAHIRAWAHCGHRGPKKHRILGFDPNPVFLTWGRLRDGVEHLWQPCHRVCQVSLLLIYNSTIRKWYLYFFSVPVWFYLCWNGHINMHLSILELQWNIVTFSTWKLIWNKIHTVNALLQSTQGLKIINHARTLRNGLLTEH